VGILGRVLKGGSRQDTKIPDTLKIEVLDTSLGVLSNGTRKLTAFISVENLSGELLERLTISWTLKQDGVGAVYAVEQVCDVQLAPGDDVEIDLDLGEVPLEDISVRLRSEVRVVGSRHVYKVVPTYVLPESSTGVCTIEEPFLLVQGVVVERIDISLSRNLLRNRGWARVMYGIRIHRGISQTGFSLLTRFYSMSGVLLGEATESFQLDALSENSVTSKVTLQQARGLGATRFEAEFDGFQAIASGAVSSRAIAGASRHEEKRTEVWEGEEVKGAYWVDRPAR
jgi:hypothetical protein